MQPLVSVIIPAYNSGSFLETSLNSVLSQGVPLEVLIVDSSADDSCAKIAQRADSRVRYLYQPPRGVSAARNVGIEMSQGEFIAFQDADDEWLSEKLCMQVAAFQKFPDAALIFTDTMMFRDGDVVQNSMYHHTLKAWCDDHKSDIPRWFYGSLYRQLLIDNCMNTSSVLIRRKVLDQCGIFDEKFKVGEDYDLWLRMARSHPMVYIDQVVCKYRIHPDGLSGDDEVRGVRWLEAHVAAREKHRRAGWVPSEHKELLGDVLGQRYWALGWNHFGYNRLGEARKCFWASLRLRPLQAGTWLYLFSTFLPVAVIESIRYFRVVKKDAATIDA